LKLLTLLLPIFASCGNGGRLIRKYIW